MFAAKNDELDVVQAMIARKANLDAQRVDGFTALHFAAGEGHTEVLRAFKSEGATSLCATSGVDPHLTSRSARSGPTLRRC